MRTDDRWPTSVVHECRQFDGFGWGWWVVDVVEMGEDIVDGADGQMGRLRWRDERRETRRDRTGGSDWRPVCIARLPEGRSRALHRPIRTSFGATPDQV